MHPVEQPALQPPPAPEPPTQEDSPLSRLPIPGGERISQYGKTIRDPGQTEQIVQISVRIPRSLREVVRLWCVDTGMSLQEFMTLAAENLCYELQRRGEE